MSGRIVDLVIDIENEKSGSPCKIANKLGTVHDRESQHVTRAWATLSSESLPHERVCSVYFGHTPGYVRILCARNEMGERMRNTRIGEFKKLGEDSACVFITYFFNKFYYYIFTVKFMAIIFHIVSIY